MKHNCLTGKGREGKGREGKGREGKGRAGKGSKRKGKDATFWGRANKASGSQSISMSADIDTAAWTDTKHVSQRRLMRKLTW